MKLITREEIPRWYSLSWEPNTILLRVDRVVLASVGPFTPDTPVVRALLDTFGFVNFTGESEGWFGFGKALEVREENGEVCFLARIPQIRVRTDKPCTDCKGSGWDKFRQGERCFSCEGNGQNYEFRWEGADAIAASLNVLFTLLEFPERETTREQPQLFIVRLVAGREAYGLGGSFGIPLRRWLSAYRPGTSLVEMTNVMINTYAHMFGISRVGQSSFRASVDSSFGWLNVDCPGQGCGFYPHHNFESRLDKGYEFSSHNVDDPGQQLTLLAGLAALHDLVDRELFG